MKCYFPKNYRNNTVIIKAVMMNYFFITVNLQQLNSQYTLYGTTP